MLLIFFLRRHRLNLRPRRVVLRSANCLIRTDLDVVLLSAFQPGHLLGDLAVSFHCHRLLVLGKLAVCRQLDLISGDSGRGALFFQTSMIPGWTSFGKEPVEEGHALSPRAGLIDAELPGSCPGVTAGNALFHAPLDRLVEVIGFRNIRECLGILFRLGLSGRPPEEHHHLPTGNVVIHSEDAGLRSAIPRGDAFFRRPVYRLLIGIRFP